MDFPSGQGFYSRAGQVRPQHAWLENTAVPPQTRQPGGKRRKAITRHDILIHRYYPSLLLTLSLQHNPNNTSQRFKITKEQNPLLQVP